MTPQFQKRIEMEMKLVATSGRGVFSHFKFYQTTSGMLYVEGYMSTISNVRYKLRFEISDNYPYKCPAFYIVEPSPLMTYQGVNLSAKTDYSAATHTLDAKNGWARMCLYRDSWWDANCTIFGCLKKALIWIEAFDKHRRSGVPMGDLLAHQD